MSLENTDNTDYMNVDKDKFGVFVRYRPDMSPLLISYEKGTDGYDTFEEAKKVAEEMNDEKYHCTPINLSDYLHKQT